MNAYPEHLAKGSFRELINSVLFFIALVLFVSTIGVVFYVAV